MLREKNISSKVLIEKFTINKIVHFPQKIPKKEIKLLQDGEEKISSKCGKGKVLL